MSTSALLALPSYLLDLLWSFTQCLSCFPSTPSLTLNNHKYKIIRLLGEGGFSYVYLVQRTSSSSQSSSSPTQLYALKKIRCPFGSESVRGAMREIDGYKSFEGSRFIIPLLDYAVVSDKDSGGSAGFRTVGGDDGDVEAGGGGGGGGGGSKTVYALLPYYRKGNLQDGINANLVNGTRFPMRRLLSLFKGICEGLKEMHVYDGNKGQRRNRIRKEDDEDGGRDEQEGFIDNTAGSAQDGNIKGYAHRDIKPANIMISDDGLTPIVMDLGSITPSPTQVTSRSQALAIQDQAAEHSTMPYRAPELFDVKTGSTIDTKVDIWSLGCTLYACLIGKSPFEARSEETGGSLSLCVLGGDWKFPDDGKGRRGSEKARGKMSTNSSVTIDTSSSSLSGVESVSIDESVKDIVRRCLKVEPAERPDVGELITIIDEVLMKLPEDDNAL